MRACAPLKASFQMRLACIRLLSAARKLFFQVARGPSVPRAFRAPRRSGPPGAPCAPVALACLVKAAPCARPSQGQARFPIFRASCAKNPTSARFYALIDGARCAQSISARAAHPLAAGSVLPGGTATKSAESQGNRLRRRCAALTFVCLCGVLPDAWPLALPPKLRPPERMRDFPPSVPQGGDATPNL